MKEARRVLVIDDEPTLLDAIRKALERVGYRVRGLLSATTAIDLLQRERFDLLLVDLLMPEVGGLEVVERVRATRPELPIVVMTAYGSEAMASEAYRRGARGFLLKPFTPAELRAAVGKAHTG